MIHINESPKSRVAIDHSNITHAEAFDEDAAHEFKAGADWQLRRASMPKYLTAFLNGGGGTVFFGVTDRGEVCGVRLSPGHRDRVRLELDQDLRSMFPALSPACVRLNFVPVLPPPSPLVQAAETRVTETQLALVAAAAACASIGTAG